MKWLAAAGLLLCLALPCAAVYGAVENGSGTGTDADSAAFTPKGNLTLIDDVVSPADGNKEFLTVESKEGDIFYIIIDRDTDGEGNVYFLNLVDDTDIYAITGTEKTLEETIHEQEYPDDEMYAGICTCTDKCTGRSVNAECSVCRKDYTKCEGTESIIKLPEDSTVNDGNTQDGAEEPKDAEKPGVNPAALAVGIAVPAILAVVYFKKFRNKTNNTEEEYSPEDYEEEENDNGSN